MEKGGRGETRGGPSDAISIRLDGSSSSCAITISLLLALVIIRPAVQNKLVPTRTAPDGTPHRARPPRAPRPLRARATRPRWRSAGSSRSLVVARSRGSPARARSQRRSRRRAITTVMIIVISSSTVIIVPPRRRARAFVVSPFALKPPPPAPPPATPPRVVLARLRRLGGRARLPHRDDPRDPRDPRRGRRRRRPAPPRDRRAVRVRARGRGGARVASGHDRRVRLLRQLVRPVQGPHAEARGPRPRRRRGGEGGGGGEPEFESDDDALDERRPALRRGPIPSRCWSRWTWTRSPG